MYTRDPRITGLCIRASWRGVFSTYLKPDFKSFPSTTSDNNPDTLNQSWYPSA
jgi:hypothetical protein